MILHMIKFNNQIDKSQPISVELIIDPQSHTYLYINNTLNVYLINEILEQSLTLLTFFLNQ